MTPLARPPTSSSARALHPRWPLGPPTAPGGFVVTCPRPPGRNLCHRPRLQLEAPFIRNCGGAHHSEASHRRPRPTWAFLAEQLFRPSGPCGHLFGSRSFHPQPMRNRLLADHRFPRRPPMRPESPRRRMPPRPALIRTHLQGRLNGMLTSPLLRRSERVRHFYDLATGTASPPPWTAPLPVAGSSGSQRASHPYRTSVRRWSRQAR